MKTNSSAPLVPALPNMFRRFLYCLLPVVCGLLLLAAAPKTGLRFEVRLAAGFDADIAKGRVLVALSSSDRREPRQAIGRTGLDAPPVLGADAHTPSADRLIATLDDTSEIFPIEHLSNLKPGTYRAQAIVHRNPDLNYPNAPGDLYGPPVQFEIKHSADEVVQLDINAQMPAETQPADTDAIKYLKLPSKLLSDFHGRPMFLRAAVVLPRDFATNPTAKYPLRVHIGGYGQRYTSARMLAARRPADGPHFISLMLDGAGPYGDPYQVNSANNGPYGDAVTQELIPHVEKTYRGIGAPHARFTDGHSTGGWVSFALQVFYPDFFNGCWSFCPDPVDFRAFELINIYEDENAYVNQHGFERPAMRQVNGDTVYTVRHECQIENVLGLGNRWTLSGKDWGAWNATFGPCGSDGLPKPLWHGKTGAIDHSVTAHWQQYDLRQVLQRNWKTIGPKLQGKIHLYSGDADDYFLNNAAHLLQDFLKKADPPAEATIIFGPNAGHSFHPLSEKQLLDAMWTATQTRRD